MYNFVLLLIVGSLRNPVCSAALEHWCSYSSQTVLTLLDHTALKSRAKGIIQNHSVFEAAFKDFGMRRTWEVE